MPSSRPPRHVGTTWTPPEAGRALLVMAALLVVAQAAFRAWALFSSWFYLDDYRLLLDAQGRRLDEAYLLDPYNNHLMPAGRLLAWVVEQSGSLEWTLAATVILVLQVLAGLAAVWMLVTLFGRRWGVLAPLALYLASVVTVPAMMWWTAGLNQVFLQAAFFGAVAGWVHYLRGRRLRWLIVSTVFVVLGLAFYVKALLILPVLAFVAVAYFGTGGPVRRVFQVLRRYWPAVLVGGLVAGAYVAYYLRNVPQPLSGTTADLSGQIAETMVGEAFFTAVVGGPWRWMSTAPPNSFADPPDWAVHASWVFLAGVVAVGLLRRTGTAKAWLLLAGYLGALLGLLVSSRAPVYGSLIGLEYRYLTDAACALALCTGLAFLELRDAPGSSRPREQPLLTPAVPSSVVALVVVLVVASSGFSTWRYVRTWHTQNASDAYLHELRSALRQEGEVDLVDTIVPESVVPQIFAPDNRVSLLVPLVSDRAHFPDASGRLATVGSDGRLRRTAIQPGVRSAAGPRDGCGWLVTARGRSIPLTGAAFDWTWWIRIGYLAGATSPVRVVAGDDEVTAEIQRGLHELFVHVEGSFDEVRIEGLDSDATMCVDTVEVGQPVSGGAWE